MNISEKRTMLINQTVGILNELILAVKTLRDGRTADQLRVLKELLQILIGEIPSLSDRRTIRKILMRTGEWVTSNGRDGYAKPRLIHLVHTYPKQTRDAIQIIERLTLHMVPRIPKVLELNKYKRMRKQKRR